MGIAGVIIWPIGLRSILKNYSDNPRRVRGRMLGFEFRFSGLWVLDLGFGVQG